MGNHPDSETAVASDNDVAAWPGRRLGKAREARHLTREAVAAQLRVETRVIEALERDDYASLPAAVFVRGYLRGYARLAALPAEPLIAAYDRLTAQTPPPLILPTAIGPDMTPHRRTYARWAVLVVVAALLLLYFLWWRMERGATPQDAAVPQTVIPEPGRDAGAVTGISGIGSNHPLATPYNVSPDAAVAVPESSPVAPAPLPESVPPDTPTLNEAEPAPPPAKAAPAAVPPEPTPPLVLRFNADSWVVIRDASGNTLLQGMFKSGDRRELTGQAPFQLTLGNSPAVDVEYQGQRIDQSRYNDPDKVARFTLGQ